MSVLSRCPSLSLLTNYFATVGNYDYPMYVHTLCTCMYMYMYTTYVVNVPCLTRGVQATDTEAAHNDDIYLPSIYR